jgi:hypothetical protein
LKIKCTMPWYFTVHCYNEMPEGLVYYNKLVKKGIIIIIIIIR